MYVFGLRYLRPNVPVGQSRWAALALYDQSNAEIYGERARRDDHEIPEMASVGVDCRTVAIRIGRNPLRGWVTTHLLVGLSVCLSVCISDCLCLAGLLSGCFSRQWFSWTWSTKSAFNLFLVGIDDICGLRAQLSHFGWKKLKIIFSEKSGKKMFMTHFGRTVAPNSTRKPIVP